MYGDERKLTNATRPACPDCEIGMVCTDCEDLRPTAEDLYEEWELRSPLGRWEIVTKVDRPKFGKISVYTKQCGGQPWRYWRETKVDARYPKNTFHGDPEIRLCELGSRLGMMWLQATQSTTVNPRVGDAGELAMARHNATDRRWDITHRPAGAEEDVVIHCTSKSRARTELKKLGRQYAKTLGVKHNLEGKTA